MKRVPRLHVVLRRSRQAVGWFATPAVATALLLWTLPWPWWLLFIADLALAAWACWMWRRLMPEGLPGGVEALTLSADRQLRLYFADDATDDPEEGFPAQVLDDTCLGDAFLTLVWRSETSKRSRTLFLLPDMMTANDWRCLRVLLRNGRATAETT
ncbi:MAG: hypothetical protein LBE75_05585 [Burkholderiales bacterium]|jgi:hypothetical protein|nr:hypothetical protein [Burkholderiales bacterium]